MRIAIPSLPSGRHNFRTAAPASNYGAFAAASGLRFIGVIGVDVVANKMNEELFVRAAITATVHAECARCVEPIEVPITTAFEALFLPDRLRDTSILTHCAQVESQRILYYSGGVVDLDEQIIEALTLAAPMKPLCRPDCKGICLRCGTNLNEGHCACKKGDSFGTPLKGLFGKG